MRTLSTVMPDGLKADWASTLCECRQMGPDLAQCVKLAQLRKLAARAGRDDSGQFAFARPGRGAGDLAEHRAGAQARAARIVEVEDAADQLARRVEAGDRLVVGVEHLRSRC